MSRLTSKVRKEQLLQAAIDLASTNGGYTSLTRKKVADKAGVSEALVSLHWGTMPQLRRSVMREAIRVVNLPVIAQGLAIRDSVAMKAPKETKTQAMQSLL